MFRRGHWSLTYGLDDLVNRFSRSKKGGNAPAGAKGTAPETISEHVPWLDTAKGIGIILVVYGHQLRAQMAAGKVEGSWHASTQDAIIYSFHMPLFFLISGLTIAKVFRRRKLNRYIRSRLINLMYPYVLWSFLSLVLAVEGRRYVQHQVGLNDFISIWWRPLFQFWFLYALFICQIIFALLRGIRSLVLILAVVLLVVPVDLSSPILIDVVKSFPFFAAGVLFSSRLTSLGSCPRMSLIGIGLLSCAIFTFVFTVRNIFNVYSGPSDFVLAGSGILAVLTISALIFRQSPLLTLLGTYSMAVYVLHTIVAVGVRSVLASTALRDFQILEMTICITAGLILPVGIQRCLRQMGLVWLSGLGGPSKSLSRRKEN